MGTILKNILSFTGLVIGVPVSLPHELNVNGVPVKPQLGGIDAPGFDVVADTVNVTVTRTTATTGNVGVYVEHWHTIEDVTPPGGLDTLTPFFLATGGGGGGGTVHTNNTLTGDGSIATPLGVDIAVVAGDLAGDVAVVTDGTLTGNGTTGSPLHVVGGGGGGAPVLTISRFTPAEGDTVNLVANAMNVVDVRNIVNNINVQLPLSATAGAGSVVQVAFVNLAAVPDAKRAQWIGFGPPNAVGVVDVACSGADTCNGVVGGAFAAFVKLSDNACFIADGILDWIVQSASWSNATVNTAALVPGDNQVVFPGAIPEIIYCGALAGNTSVIQTLSAGYIGQKIIIQNTDATHTFKLQPGFAGALTGNCQPLSGIVAGGYVLQPGSMRMLEFNFDSNDATLANWYVIGDA